MFGKKKAKGKTKTATPVSKPQTTKRITKKEKLEKLGIEQGYRAIIKLPDGKKLTLTRISLADDSDIHSNPVVFETKEQANKSAKLAAKAYYKEKGIEASPAIGIAYDIKEGIIRSEPTATKTATCKRTTSPKSSKSTNRTAKQSSAANPKSKKK